jgi:uncharacterized Tic20 family protein
MDKTILDNFLVEMIELLRTAKDFTLEQAPQVAREFLHYHAILSLVWILVGFIGILFSFKFKNKTDEYVKKDPTNFPFYLFVAIPFLLSSALTLLNVMNLVEIELAPRTYLIEYVSSLVNPHCK